MNKFAIQAILGLMIFITSLAVYFRLAQINPPKNNSHPLTQTSLKKTSDQKITFDDEPIIVKSGFKVASASAWIKTEGETISVSRDTNSIELVLGSVDEVWKKLPKSKIELANLHLSKEKYDFFYNQTLLPSRVNKSDLNGDGREDQFFLSKIVNCNKCYQYFVDIFIDSQVFKTTSNDGEVIPLKNKKGFYLTNYFTGIELATTSPDKVIISRYEWQSNNTFKEVSRKIVNLEKEN